jgi:hypothetical protein
MRNESNDTVLAPGQSETGTWSTSLNVAAGGFQQEAVASIVFPCPLGEGVRVKFFHENEHTLPGEPCTQLVAPPGYLCVYESAGVAKPGMREREWIHATFFSFADPAGNFGGNKPSGRIGELVLFRTEPFKEGEPTTTLSEGAVLSAGGEWSVTAPCLVGETFNGNTGECVK